MTYYLVENFAAGMDVRKSAMTAPAGTLRLLKDAVVNPGGEIQKRWAFLEFAAAPVGSVGLLRKGDFLYAVSAGGVTVPPTDTTVGNLALAGLPGGVTIAKLLDYAQYADKLYTAVLGSDDLVYHHYDGVLVPDGKGTALCTYRSKMYAVDGRYLRFSAVGAPDDWVGTGSGVIDLSAEDTEMLDCRAIEVYYDKLAVFSQRACQIWFVDPDPNKNYLVQTLRQAGITAPRSARQYGSGDVLYLSQDGIRSLKSREQTLTASVSDLGSPMDPYIQELYRNDVVAMQEAIAVLEPANGRYWFVAKDRILVLSNYPSPKISAWGVFFPEFNMADAAVAGPFMYVRDVSGMVWRYGAGLEAEVFDDALAEVILPYLSFDKPATQKQFKGIDVACQGPWQVYASFNPKNEGAEDLLGTLDGPTFLDGAFAMMGNSTHCSLRFRTSANEACLLSSIMIHYDETKTD